MIIKAMLQAIPMYCMRALLLPSALIDELQRMLNAFWWGTRNKSGNEIRWLSWSKLMKKDEGAMSLGLRILLTWGMRDGI